MSLSLFPGERSQKTSQKTSNAAVHHTFFNGGTDSFIFRFGFEKAARFINLVGV